MAISSIFAERLSELIAYANITPAILSKSIDIDLSLIYKYLRAEFLPSVKNSVNIAHYFRCTLDFLFGNADNYVPTDFTVDETFSARLNFTLNEANCTKYRLQKDKGFSKQSIYDWCNGKRDPSIEVLVILARYFDVSIDFLAGLSCRKK